MAWMRRKNRTSNSNDPFQFLNVQSPQNLVANSAVEDLQKSRKQLVFFGCLIAIVLTVLAYAIYSQINLRFGEDSTAYAYFEIKAINEEGSPVAGAEVYHNNSAIGLTDSFGEWRRYLQVELGSEMLLHFAKRREGRTIQVKKRIKIPESKPSKGDIEIFASVLLKNNTSRLKRTQLASSQKRVQRKMKPTKKVRQGKVFVELSNASNENNKLQVLALKKKIIPLINEYIKTDKTKLRHNCTEITLSYIPYKKTRGFAEIECLNNGVEWSLIRNIESSKKSTAFSIFEALQRTARMKRTKKSPVVGWQPLSVVFTGALDKEAKIYISGYPASHSQEGYWRYFGQKGGRANLMIIHQGKVLHRERITNNPYGARYINLPHKSLAQNR